MCFENLVTRRTGQHQCGAAQFGVLCSERLQRGPHQVGAPCPLRRSAAAAQPHPYPAGESLSQIAIDRLYMLRIGAAELAAREKHNLTLRRAWLVAREGKVLALAERHIPQREFVR